VENFQTTSGTFNDKPDFPRAQGRTAKVIGKSSGVNYS